VTLFSSNRVENKSQLLGRDIAVGIGTRYGLDCPRLERRLRQNGPHPSRAEWVPRSSRVPFPEVKRPRREVDHLPTSNAEATDRVELYLHSSSRLSRPVLG
jgi:hypothetical protein